MMCRIVLLLVSVEDLRGGTCREKCMVLRDSGMVS
jgi:hypothetical protein